MKWRLYRFLMRHGVVTNDKHLNDFIKLFADLLNLDEEVIDEYKVLLLNSQSDEYETS
ncbi:hypothetical protein MA16_Dca020146 [Dendrobium catenatum]|uniref:Uncharacterized protein n=1 Tax=Dendrobium catenatum TaxID=906689 RepID=A0A2I0WES8_9ASPA|nr:hypothetical protein MA16_Dca020146 [Dendrobium catenatum]